MPGRQRVSLALQTAARRRGGGFATATIGLASNGTRAVLAAHVTSSAYVPMGESR